jgi:mannose-6-phosphate isomerase-like protein (cupin superfamily)
VGTVILLGTIGQVGRLSLAEGEDQSSPATRGETESFAAPVARTYAVHDVEQHNIKRFVHFSSDGVRRETVFETARLWTQVLCFQRNQTIGPIKDSDSDGIFLVVAGEAVFLVDGKRKRLAQWGTVLVPAGSEVTVTNASAEPLVVLLVAAPPPPFESLSG